MEIDSLSTKADANCPFVPVAKGLEAISPIYATGIAEGRKISLKIEARPMRGKRSGHYECTELHVEQVAPGGPPITLEFLQRVPVAGIIRKAVEKKPPLAVAWTSGRRRMLATPPSVEELRRMAEDGPSDELNPWLMYLYRHALVTGLPPSATVAATLGKSTATIRRWLAPLRESGELPEPEGPGRAGG